MSIILNADVNGGYTIVAAPRLRSDSKHLDGSAINQIRKSLDAEYESGLEKDLLKVIKDASERSLNYEQANAYLDALEVELKLR